jgi:hypothetical protein
MKVVPIRKHSNPYSGQPLEDKSLLLKLSGGVGEIIMLSGVLRKIRMSNPYARITLASDAAYSDVAGAIPVLSGFLPIQNGYEPHDYVRDLDDAIGNANPGTHPADALAAGCGFKLMPKERAPEWFPDRRWAERAVEYLRRVVPEDRHSWSIAVVQAAGIDPDFLFDVLSGLVAEKVIPVAVGRPGDLKRPGPGDLKRPGPGVVNTCGCFPFLWHSIGAVVAADVFLGPPFGLIHAAGAVEVPSVAFCGRLSANTSRTSTGGEKVPQNRMSCANPVSQYQGCVSLGRDGASVSPDQAIQAILDRLKS